MTATGGGTTDATGGTGGDRTFGETYTEACIAYGLAVCTKSAQCSGAVSASCAQATFSCPDLVFSAGSTRTIEGMLECATAYAEFPCSDYLAGYLPPCVTPGTVQVGEPCLFASQCASLYCAVSSQQECGMCAELAGLDDPCDGFVTICEGGLMCDGGRCVAFQAPPGDTRPGPGDPCTGVNQCTVGHYCDIPSGDTTGTCVSLPGENESCAERRSCAFNAGLYCELDSLICRSAPGLGEPCGRDAWTGSAAYCDDSLACQLETEESGTCVPRRGEGEPCLLHPEAGVPVARSCETGLTCDTRQATPVCVPLSGPTEPCDPPLACDQGLTCMCDGDPPECATRSCRYLRFASESCDGPGERCHPGFDCRDGTCQAHDSQGLFGATCGD